MLSRWIFLLHKNYFGDWNVEVDGAVVTSEDGYVLAALEIKTRVAASSVGKSSTLASANLIRYEIGDETCRKYVPKEPMVQVLHQLVVLRFGLALYVCASETGTMYIAIIRCIAVLLDCCRRELTTALNPIVGWVHIAEPTLPSYVKRGYKESIVSR